MRNVPYHLSMKEDEYEKGERALLLSLEQAPRSCTGVSFPV